MTEEKCFLCADSKFTSHHAEKKDFVGDKLFASKNFMITAVGLHYGVHVMEGMLSASEMTGIDTLEEAEEYLFGLGQQQYALFLDRYGASLSKELCRLYFIVAGRERSGKPGMIMIGSEGRAPFSRLQLGKVITAPRRMGIEMNLVKLLEEDENSIMNSIMAAVRKLSEVDKGISGPYLMGVIGKQGCPRVIRIS